MFITYKRQVSSALGQIQALQARGQTHVDDREGTGYNNIPPRRSSATARAAIAAATPMTAAAVEQLIEARVSAALANHETLRNSSNGHGDGSHNSNTRIRGTVRTPWKDVFHQRESEEVEKYVGGLPDMIQGNVMSYQPKTMEKAIEFANDQMDQKVLTITKRQAEQKRKLEFNAGNNQGHQQQNKRRTLGGLTLLGLLSKYHALIDCAEKIICIPWGNETLIVHGNGSNQGNGTRLNIISCTKTHEYLLKGHNVFLAHVTTKEAEDKSGEKRLEDVPIIRDFPEVFPKDLSGLPPT
ncbi:hypothetical protein Tco_0706094 [Tanacetum coccineum]|uniref:Reverse transcriptase domain-containing protein n=1 Tax=Tanacetum coccineum TaxID=301880 RepID=A0ABQ4Y803_9ASTR